MLKNKLCKSIIAVIVAVVVFLPSVMYIGSLDSYADDEYKIYAEDGDIRSYVTGEGSYFNAHRSFYRDSAGHVVYCLQSGMMGASVSGTTGYIDNQAEISSNKSLMDNIRRITAKGYPSQFDTYAVGGSDKNPVYKTGLMIDGNIYECTKEEARAATAFAIHRKMIEYGKDNPDAAIGNNETILSYKNGMSAVNDVIGIHERLMKETEAGEAVIYMEWAVKRGDGSYEKTDNLVPCESDANDSMCVYAHISSAYCYVYDITLFDGEGYVNGAFIDKVEYISAFEKYICIKIPNTPENYDKAVGIACTARKGGAEPAKIMGNTDCQDIIVVPSSKENIGESLDGYLPGGLGCLYKMDYDTKKPISGVVYGVYSDIECTDKIMEITTDHNGYASSGELECGIYYIKEIRCPAGYIIDTKVYELEVSPGMASDLMLYNKRLPITIEIIKHDAENNAFIPQGDASLIGAVYGVYAREDILHIDGRKDVIYGKDSVVGKITIGRDGSGCVNNLYPGKYYVKEITPPIGYTLDDTEYEVDCTVDDSSATVIKKQVIVDEVPEKQAFQLVKFYGKEGEEQKPLEGAGFSAWLISSLNINENGEYDFESADPYPIGKDGAAEMYTDHTGYACSTELPYGEYIVRETTVPDGFLRVEDFTVTVSEDSRTPQTLRMFNDEHVSARLKIIKTDGETGKVITEPGYGFKIYDMTNECYVKQKATYPVNGIFELFETNEEGYLILPEKLPAGNYRIEEVSLPDGSRYELNSDYIEFVISGDTVYKTDNNEAVVEVCYPNNPIRFTSVDFYKRDYITENIVAGATLVLKDSAGNEIERWVSEDVPHSVSGLLPGEEYTLEEEFAPYGYLKAEDVTFTISECDSADEATAGDCDTDAVNEATASDSDMDAANESGQEVIIYDKYPTGRIKINKYGDVISSVNRNEDVLGEKEIPEIEFEKKVLSDVEFTLYAAEDIVHPDGSGKVAYSAGSMIMAAATDENGTALFDGLMLGKYLIVETKSDAEHIVKPYSIPVNLEYIDQYTELVEAESSVWNDRIESRIKINKVDAETGEVLKGASFGLYSDEDIYDEDGKLIFPKDSMIDCKISDEGGTAYFRNSLVPGEYYIRELTAPAGYILSDEKYDITILREMDTELEFNMENKRVGIVLGETGVSEIKEASQEVQTGDKFNPAVAVMLIIAVMGMLIISFCFYLRGR